MTVSRAVNEGKAEFITGVSPTTREVGMRTIESGIGATWTQYARAFPVSSELTRSA